VLVTLVVLSLLVRRTLSSLLVCCGSCAYIDIIHPFIFSTSSFRSEAKDGGEGTKSKFPLCSLYTHLVILSYSLSKTLCSISPFYRQILCESLINTIYSIQLKTSEEDPNPNSPFSRYPPCYLVVSLMKSL
jgi:hypothetical protein